MLNLNFEGEFIHLCHLQEFAIEIPDAEADEIKTVQQGTFPFIIVLCFSQLRDVSPQQLTILQRHQKVCAASSSL